MAGENTVPLEKSLGLLDVYALATGATLSAGFFLLPGLAAVEAGPALVAAYLLAAVPLVPAILCKVELMTAMPRAGGIYYYLDRSLGPLAGTIGGLGIWFVLMLKVSFALIGMGAYLALFLPDLPIVPVALGLAVAAGLVNALGAKLSGGLQVALVVGLLAILGGFIALGIPSSDPARFGDFFGAGAEAVFATAGLVYVSYAGLTKIAGVAEEVENPERNLPLGVFLALGTALLVYGAGTAVIVGVVPMEELRGSLTSVATAGEKLLGTPGMVALSAAALMAFVAVTNAGTMSASRYPLAMSRDHLLPGPLERLSDRGTPALSIALTVGVMVLVLVFLEPMKIAKLASAFKLLVFSLVCLSVIVMRESGIEEYDPGYLAPAYPWLHLFGVLAPLPFIVILGWMPALFSLGLIVASAAWYWRYAREQVVREGAIYHIFERLGRRRHRGLERELRGILKEKGLRETDPFGQLVGDARVLDLEEAGRFEDVVREASARLADVLPITRERLEKTFLEETELGVTPVAHGAALPHVRCADLDAPRLLMVRARDGLRVGERPSELSEAPGEGETDGPAIPRDGAARDGDRVHAIFFLASPENDARQHLRMLAKLAERVERDDFLDEWLAARGEHELKAVLVHEEGSFTVRLQRGEPSGRLIGLEVGSAPLPEGILVTLLRRGGRVLAAEEHVVLQEGDRLTVLGEPEAVDELRERYRT